MLRFKIYYLVCLLILWLNWYPVTPHFPGCLIYGFKEWKAIAEEEKADHENESEIGITTVVRITWNLMSSRTEEENSSPLVIPRTLSHFLKVKKIQFKNGLFPWIIIQTSLEIFTVNIVFVLIDYPNTPSFQMHAWVSSEMERLCEVCFLLVKSSPSTLDPKAVLEGVWGGILGWTGCWHVKKWDVVVPGLWLVISFRPEYAQKPYFKFSSITPSPSPSAQLN